MLLKCTLVRMKSFQDYEETIHSAEINDTSYECPANFIGMDQKKILENPITKNQKNVIYQLNQYPIYHFGTRDK